ncbi:unnamed protein product, partial [Amoebophrya sp. A120]
GSPLLCRWVQVVDGPKAGAQAYRLYRRAADARLDEATPTPDYSKLACSDTLHDSVEGSRPFGTSSSRGRAASSTVKIEMRKEIDSEALRLHARQTL